MPVEIKELVIRVAVQESNEPSAVLRSAPDRPVAGEAARLDYTLHHELIEACVQAVLDRLERKNDR